MKSRTIFILVTFIILFAINKVGLYHDIKKQSENLSTVNISGRQRMYSQKISKLSLFYLENFKNQQLNNASLKETLNNFSNAHESLKNNLSSFDNENLNALFRDLEPNFNNLVLNGNKLLNNNNAYTDVKESVNSIVIYANNFLPIMDNIVNLYEKIGIETGERILKREFTFNLILLGLSIYTLFFIVFPIINAYYKSEGFTLF